MLSLLLPGLAACVKADCEDTRTCGDASGMGGLTAESGAAHSTGAPAQGGRGGTSGGGGVGGKATAGTGGSGGGGGAAGSAGSSGEGGTPSGGAAGTAGNSGSGGEGGAIPICDPLKAPSTEACLVHDDLAIFVSPTGSENALGTKSDPVRSLAAAILLADDEDKIVVACTTEADVFTSPLELTGEITARVYGGFKCEDWTWTEARTLVAPESGVALKLDAVSGALHLEDFEFRAAPAAEPGQSSVGAVFNATTGVSLQRVTIAAGDGADGKGGAAIADYASAAPNGNGANGTTGGGPKGGTEPDGCGCDTTGGRGGDAIGTDRDGDLGLPDYGGGEGGNGEVACNAGGGGGDGADAPASPRGAGATNYGKLEGLTWTPASGDPGNAGEPGQGGGGGGGDPSGGGGGGGACGGCGGKGGNPGGGGGASIAVIWVNSEVTFLESRLETANGGDGGAGAKGQTGQEGGNGGRGAEDGGCQGGRGGTGANGGSGGGGVGGISVGILYRGAAPAETALLFALGVEGGGGDGGDPGLNDGSPGTWSQVLAVGP